MWALQIALLCATVITVIQCKSVDYDYETAASEPHGRVQIKVFRGPTEQDGDQQFAPWGYFVKQPVDTHQ